MHRTRCLMALLLAAGLLLVRSAAAQDPRLERRLDVATREAVGAIVEAARAAGLPVETLVDRALEGAAKRADGPRIVAAVRLLATELAAARDALGPASSPGELEAGAGALRAGVPAADLTLLRQRRARPLTVALGALTDLVTSGVPPDSAAAAVLALAASAGDDQLLDFRRAVERDIALGAPPAAAAAVRVDAAIRQTPTTRKP